MVRLILTILCTTILFSCDIRAAQEKHQRLPAGKYLVLKNGTARPIVRHELVPQGWYKVWFEDGSWRTYGMKEAFIRVVSRKQNPEATYQRQRSGGPPVAKTGSPEKKPIAIWKNQIRPGQRLAPGTIILSRGRNGKVQRGRVISHENGRLKVAYS